MAKRLFRSTTDRKIAGVCAGVAEYFDIDPVIVRIIWVAMVLGAGFGLLAYIIAWLIVPEGSNLNRISDGSVSN